MDRNLLSFIPGNGCDSYSVSQSQSINFSQAMRARPAGAAPQPQPQSQGAPPLDNIKIILQSEQHNHNYD